MTERIACTDSNKINQQVEFAGFWLRVVAFLIDSLILAATDFLLDKLFSSIWINWVLPLGYFVGFNSSKYQGTIGKIIVGIRITDLSGNRISVIRALARYCVPNIFLVFQVLCFIYFWSSYLARSISEGILALILLFFSSIGLIIGYLMTAFTVRKQALHDIVCETLVIRADT